MGSITIKTLEQLNSNHMGMEKTTIAVRYSIYWINRKADIDDTGKNCSTSLGFQETQQKHKVLPHEIPVKPEK